MIDRERHLKSLSVGELMEEVAAESGNTPSALTQDLLKEQQRIHDMVANTEGRYRVLAVDTFDHEDWVDAEFDFPEEAIAYVLTKTTQAEENPNLQGFKWDYSRGEMVRYSETTSRFYAYTPEGNYINPIPKNPQDTQR